jgi:hypothetical protein
VVVVDPVAAAGPDEEAGDRALDDPAGRSFPGDGLAQRGRDLGGELPHGGGVIGGEDERGDAVRQDQGEELFHPLLARSDEEPV